MGPECTPDGTGQLVGAVFTRMASMEPEFALRMEQPLPPQVADTPELQWSRSLHSGWNERRNPWGMLRRPLQWSRSLHSGWNPTSTWNGCRTSRLQWSRSLHSGWNPGESRPTPRASCFNGAGVCTPDGTRRSHDRRRCCRASMEPEFALRMELFPQNSKGKQALQTAFSSTRTERANLPFHPARGKKKFLYSC